VSSRASPALAATAQVCRAREFSFCASHQVMRHWAETPIRFGERAMQRGKAHLVRDRFGDHHRDGRSPGFGQRPELRSRPGRGARARIGIEQASIPRVRAATRTLGAEARRENIAHTRAALNAGPGAFNAPQACWRLHRRAGSLSAERQAEARETSDDGEIAWMPFTEH